MKKSSLVAKAIAAARKKRKRREGLSAKELVTIETLYGRNPLTGAPIETPIREPAKGAVSPLQAPGWSHRKKSH